MKRNETLKEDSFADTNSYLSSFEKDMLLNASSNLTSSDSSGSESIHSIYKNVAFSKKGKKKNDNDLWTRNKKEYSSSSSEEPSSICSKTRTLHDNKKKYNKEYVAVIESKGGDKDGDEIEKSVTAPITSHYVVEFLLKIKSKIKTEKLVKLKIMVDGDCVKEKLVKVYPGYSSVTLEGKVFCQKGQDLWLKTNNPLVRVVEMKGGISAIKNK